MLILDQDNYTDYLLCNKCLLWRNVVRYNVKLKKSASNRYVHSCTVGPSDTGEKGITIDARFLRPLNLWH